MTQTNQLQYPAPGTFWTKRTQETDPISIVRIVRTQSKFPQMAYVDEVYRFDLRCPIAGQQINIRYFGDHNYQFLSHRSGPAPYQPLELELVGRIWQNVGDLIRIIQEITPEP